jgi:hypothetical protein
MDAERLVSITISILKSCRDQLRKIVAEINLKNPDEVTSLSQFGRKILSDYLEKRSEREEGGIRNEQSTSNC